MWLLQREQAASIIKSYFTDGCSCRSFGNVALEDRRQILREGGSGNYCVAAGLLRLLLQVDLNMRDESDHGDPRGFRVCLDSCDQAERVGGIAIQIADDQ